MTTVRLLMRRWQIALALWASLFASSDSWAGEPKLTAEVWDVAYVQGARSGYVHTYIHELNKDGIKLLRATMELRLTVLRSGEVIRLGMDTGTYELEGGKVVGTFLKHFLGTAKTLEIIGFVEGDMLKLTRDNSVAL